MAQLVVIAGGLLLFALTSAYQGDLLDLGAKEAVDLLCSRQITAVQYASALLDQAENIKCLNTYAELHRDKVLAEAQVIDDKAKRGEKVGKLCGLPVPVKDNIDIAGYKTVGGTPALEGNLIKQSAPFIDKLREAGGIVLGKARLHELAAGYTSISERYGPVLNPYDVHTHAGGSSGGSAAMIASRGAPIGFCTDTGGSCRIPASLTGVVGFRATSVSTDHQRCYKVGSGLIPLAVSRDTVGIMARSVADVEFLDAIINDCHSKRKEVEVNGLKIGYPREWWADLGDEVKPALSKALTALSTSGVELVEFDISLLLDQQRQNAPDKFMYIHEFPRELARYLTDHKLTTSVPELISKMTSPMCQDALSDWAYRDAGSWPTHADYTHMLTKGVPKERQLWHDYFDTFGFDVIIGPTTPITTRPINASEPFSSINERLEPTMVINARLFETDGPSAIPGLSIPIGFAENNLPIGLHLHSRSGDDGTLLSIGKALEKILPKTKPPPSTPLCKGLVGSVSRREPEKNVPDPTDAESARKAADRSSMWDFKLKKFKESVSIDSGDQNKEL